ncbi:MAG: peroxiredoxin [Chloroflexi bacterium]|nr:peroxiredoxin [Chloroflexota bacterium]
MLQIGKQVPDFELVNQDGQPVRMRALRGKKVVIFAFPKASSITCTRQACAFRDEFPHISAHNAVILGVGADNPEALRQWKRNHHLPYDLLCDTDRRMLETWGAWGGFDVKQLIGFPPIKRSYWVIDENGVLLDQQIGVGARESMEHAVRKLAQVGV